MIFPGDGMGWYGMYGMGRGRDDEGVSEGVREGEGALIIWNFCLRLSFF